MSAHQKKAASQSSGIIVGDGKRQWHHPVYLKLWGFGLAGVILLALIAFGTYQLFKNHNTTAKPDAPASPSALLLTKGNDSAQTALNKQISSATSNQDKAALYIQKSGIASDSKDYKNSLLYAQKAESLDPNPASAQAIGDAASALHNNRLAVRYYKLQLQRLQPIQNQDTATRIEAEITALGGTN